MYPHNSALVSPCDHAIGPIPIRPPSGIFCHAAFPSACLSFRGGRFVHHTSPHHTTAHAMHPGQSRGMWLAMNTTVEATMANIVRCPMGVASS